MYALFKRVDGGAELMRSMLSTHLKVSHVFRLKNKFLIQLVQKFQVSMANPNMQSLACST